MGTGSSAEATASSICLTATVGGKLELRGLPQVHRNRIKEFLRLRNPTYEQAVRTNPKARYALSPWIKYYQEADDGSLVVPRGTLGNVVDYCRRASVPIEIQDRTVRIPSKPCQSPVLRDYQLGIPEAGEGAAQGIFRLDTGFGKTIVAVALHALKGQRTLMIVPRLDLLENSVAEYEKHVGKRAGIVQGKRMVLEDFTVATVQSLANRIRSGHLRGDEFGMVLVDECHLFVPVKWRGSVEAFRPAYRYGFTGTLDRTDGQGSAISWIFGPTLVDKSLPGLVPEVEVRTYPGNIPSLRYDETVSVQVADEKRNRLVLDVIHGQVASGRRCLVLTKRVDHYSKLADACGTPEDGYIRCNSDESRSKRKDKMAMLKVSSDYKAVFGTFSLLSTGVDIPSLDTLVVAGDLKSHVLQRQSAGRILRLFDGKNRPLVVDIYDSGNHYFRRQGKLRHEYYRSLGWEMKYV